MSRAPQALLAAAALASGCATPVSVSDADVQRALAASFRDQGIAKVERLQQDEANAECSLAQGRPLPEAVERRLQAQALASVKMPADGRFLGDWREGERLAQNGRGMTWSDASTAPASNGGNCYNCHQIGPGEISYGTIGPSLYQYGRNRGISDPAAATARPVLEYTWSKLWNAKAYNACSGMPRFGHLGLLAEAQLQHLMALLLDPASPVNRP